MIKGINHITFAVKDIEKSFAFYKNVLGLKPLCKWKKGAYFLAGDSWFCLNVDENRKPATDCTHFAFSVDEKDFDALRDTIKKAGCKTWKENASEGASLYFEDPNGHKLEIHVGNWKNRMPDAESSNLESLELY